MYNYPFNILILLVINLDGKILGFDFMGEWFFVLQGKSLGSLYRNPPEMNLLPPLKSHPDHHVLIKLPVSKQLNFWTYIMDNLHDYLPLYFLFWKNYDLLNRDQIETS